MNRQEKKLNRPPASPAARPGPKPALWRVPLVAAAILTLLAAIWAGWIRIGWPWPPLGPSLAGAHGALMVSGFFGTLISIERAVALQRRWPYLGPALTGLGAILLIAGAGGPLPALLLALGASWLVLIFAAILRRHAARYTVVMAAGAAAWAAGSWLWLAGWPVYRVVLWWAAFLVLTIAGERLELGRLVRLPSRAENGFMAVFGLLLAGLALALFNLQWGVRLACLGLLGLAGWLFRWDIARKTIRRPGLPRFAAICLLSGYAWLVAAGVIGLRYGLVPAGFIYDAFLHSIFLGFVFAMIFAHAPIIFPAILGLPIQFKRAAYLPLVLLHASLVLRITGDLLGLARLRMWGGLLNGITVLIFLALTARSIYAGYRAKKAKSSLPGPFPAPPTRGYAASAIVSPSPHPSILRFALLAFVLAGATGSLLRFWLAAGFPAGVDFAHVRHAHSHLMFFSWVTPALMAGIAAYLPVLTGRPARRGLVRAAAAALVLGFLSFPAFFLWGYQPAVLAGHRWPLSIVLSSLNILAWYAFAVSFYQAVRGARRSRPLRLWSGAVGFLLAASLGAWGQAVLTALKIENPFLASASVELFLGLFSNGWAVLGVLGLVYASRPELHRLASGWEDPLLFAGLPLSFLLGAPVDLVPPDLRTLAGIGGLMAAGGLALHVRALWPRLRAPFWTGWGAPLALLLLKAGMDAAASLAPLARWGEAQGLRVPYLHVLLLGFASLGLSQAGTRLLGLQPGRLRGLAWAVAALLLSLLPLTGLWPAALSGDWRLWAAFLFSMGPVLAGAGLLAAWAKRPGQAAAPTRGYTTTTAEAPTRGGDTLVEEASTRGGNPLAAEAPARGDETTAAEMPARGSNPLAAQAPTRGNGAGADAARPVSQTGR